MKYKVYHTHHRCPPALTCHPIELEHEAALDLSTWELYHLGYEQFAKLRMGMLEVVSTPHYYRRDRGQRIVAKVAAGAF